MPAWWGSLGSSQLWSRVENWIDFCIVLLLLSAFSDCNRGKEAAYFLHVNVPMSEVGGPAKTLERRVERLPSSELRKGVLQGN